MKLVYPGSIGLYLPTGMTVREMGYICVVALKFDRRFCRGAYQISEKFDHSTKFGDRLTKVYDVKIQRYRKVHSKINQ